MKIGLSTVIGIVAVALAAWIFFYLTTGPLQPSETTVVVGFSALIVISAKMLWTRTRKPKKEKQP